MKFFKKNKSGDELKNLSEEAHKYIRELEEEIWKKTPQLEILKEEYKTVVEGSLVGIYVLQGGVFKYANPAFLKIFGYEKPEEIIGHQWQEIVFKEDIEKVLATGIEKRMKGGGKSVRYTLRAVKKDGTVIEVEALSSPSSYDGEPALIGSLLDITERKQKEEDLIKLNKAIDASGEGIFLTDQAGIIKYINPGFTKLYGYTAEEVIDKQTPRILKSGLVSTENYTNFWKTILSKGAVKGEIVNKTKDGQLINIEGSANPVLDEKGRIIGFLGIQRDITERKKSETKIKQLYNFQTVVRNINQLIVRIENEKDFFQQVCDILKKGEFIKFAWIGLIKNGTYEVNPIAQAGFEDGYLSSIKVTWDDSEYGKGPTGIAIKTQMPLIMGDIAGDPRYEPWREQALKQGYLSSAAIPLVYNNEVIGVLNIYSGDKDAFNGEVLGFLKEVAGDITVGIKSLRQERAIEESEEKFRKLFESSRDAIMTLKPPTWKFATGNSAAIEMFRVKNSEDFSSRTIFDYSPEKQPDGQLSSVKAKQMINKAMETGSNFFEWTLKRLDKKDFPATVLFSKVEIRGEKFLQATVRDITNEKEVEVKIKELNKLKSRFITIVSHQLRTPLNSITWNLESLLRGKMDHLPETQKNIVNISYNASLEIMSRINDLLLALDIEEGRVARVSENETSLESLWNSVMVEGSNKGALKKISFENIIPKEPIPAILVDPEKIRLVFQKLCDNAIDYTNENGKIITSLKKIDNLIRFEITDTGIGIPKVEQLPISSRFYRASNAFTMKPDASGLGLFIAKYFIEQHGGKIGFTSKEGVGSTFWFELPIIK